MRVCITGGFGFIGANLVRRLWEEGHEVTVIDNLSTGDVRFIESKNSKKITTFQVDLSETQPTDLAKILRKCETVFHLAANADVRGGWDSTYLDIKQNVIATHNLALACRIAEVNEVVFASTGCVYGDSANTPTTETEPFPIQTSLYGASKIAAEGILSTFSANGAYKVTVLRFVSVLGRFYHHGHVIDFVRQLRAFPSRLKILGNGKQKKSFISVHDCVEALVNLRGDSSFEIFNIGQTNFWEIGKSAETIAHTLNLAPKFIFGSDIRGWIGDSPITFLDINKALKHGWKPQVSIEDSIIETTDWIISNPWVLELDKYRTQS